MNHELVTSVEYSTHFAGMEVEHLFFHPDDTRKAIHVCNNKLRLAKYPFRKISAVNKKPTIISVFSTC
jgi:hypothetical protein